MRKPLLSSLTKERKLEKIKILRKESEDGHVQGREVLDCGGLSITCSVSLQESVSISITYSILRCVSHLEVLMTSNKCRAQKGVSDYKLQLAY